METENNTEIKQMTSAQEILIKKVLRSSKFTDKEFNFLKNIFEKQVLTSYDASVFIENMLSSLKFKRTFLNGKHKAFKFCHYCNSRDNVQRILHVESNKKLWVCETCALNLDNSKFVPVKITEEANEEMRNSLDAEHSNLDDIDERREATADLHRKYDYNELTPAQEDLIHEHREV